MTAIRTRVETCSTITEFQRKVYLALLEVPRGTTITYRELGEKIGCKSQLLKEEGVEPIYRTSSKPKIMD